MNNLISKTSPSKCHGPYIRLFMVFFHCSPTGVMKKPISAFQKLMCPRA